MPNSTSRKAFSHYALPTKPPRIALTDDDFRILLEVYRHDIIDSATVAKLLSHRSVDKVRRRLNSLRKSGYLIRLAQLQQIFVPGGGSRPKAYTLGEKGAVTLTEVWSLPRKRQRFEDRADRLSAQTILHGLQQTEFVVSTRMSAEHNDDVEFLYPEEYYQRFEPQVLRRDRLPYAVNARVNWYGYHQLEGTIPDGFFVLYYPTAAQGDNRRFIFLEIDRGTETIDVQDRKMKSLQFWKDTSILRKLVVYGYAHKTKSHHEAFAIPTFQVLTVTTNPKRVKLMQEMYRKRLADRPHSVPPFRFLFTDFETVRRYRGDVLSVPIADGSGGLRKLCS